MGTTGNLIFWLIFLIFYPNLLWGQPWKNNLSGDFSPAPLLTATSRVLRSISEPLRLVYQTATRLLNVSILGFKAEQVHVRLITATLPLLQNFVAAALSEECLPPPTQSLENLFFRNLRTVLRQRVALLEHPRFLDLHNTFSVFRGSTIFKMTAITISLMIPYQVSLSTSTIDTILIPSHNGYPPSSSGLLLNTMIIVMQKRPPISLTRCTWPEQFIRIPSWNPTLITAVNQIRRLHMHHIFYKQEYFGIYAS